MQGRAMERARSQKQIFREFLIPRNKNLRGLVRNGMQGRTRARVRAEKLFSQEYLVPRNEFKGVEERWEWAHEEKGGGVRNGRLVTPQFSSALVVE